MIPRSRDVIAHSPNAKLPKEDGEDAATDWGSRLGPKVKPFGEDPGDTPTRGWGNKPNPKKDPTWIEIQGWGHNRFKKWGKVRSILIPPKTRPTH